MESRTLNGRTYTRKFAWYPVRSTAGQLLWLVHYYIRPDRNGEGVLLSGFDLQLEMIRSR